MLPSRSNDACAAHEDRSVNASSTDAYVTSLDEVTWGVMLIALTMVIHGFGVIVTLRPVGPCSAVTPDARRSSRASAR